MLLSIFEAGENSRGKNLIEESVSCKLGSLLCAILIQIVQITSKTTSRFALTCGTSPLIEQFIIFTNPIVSEILGTIL